MKVVHDAFHLVIEGRLSPTRSRCGLDRLALVESPSGLMPWTWADWPIAEVVRSGHSCVSWDPPTTEDGRCGSMRASAPRPLPARLF